MAIVSDALSSVLSGAVSGIMGGGDLNTKKSWHPNTIKNQEKVWKAEQMQAHENKRIDDLRKEISNERFREELCEQGQSSGILAEKTNKKLDWMYKEPNKDVDHEQYLLGKAVDKTFEKIVANDSSQSQLKTQPKNHVEHECIPFSIRNLNTSAPSFEGQVDLARKLMEDPLMAIRKREVESRAQLLQNPVKLKQLSMLLKAEELKHKKKKERKKSKKHKKDKDELEQKIFEKLKKLGSDESTIDLKGLLKHAEKHKSKKKKKKRDKSSDSSSDSTESSNAHGKRADVKNNDLKRKYSEIDQGHNYKRKGEDEYLSKQRKEKHRSKSADDRNIEANPKQNKYKDRKNFEENSDADYQQKSKNKDSDGKMDYKQNKYRETRQYDESHSYVDSRQNKYRESRNHDDKDSVQNKYKERRDYKETRNYDEDDSRRSSKYREDEPEKKHYLTRDDSDDEKTNKQYGLIRADGTKIQINNKSQNNELPDGRSKTVETKWRKPERKHLSEKEMEEKRRQMMEDATKRDRDREKNVKYYKVLDKKEELKNKSDEFREDFVEKQLRVAASQSSLESRIKSNIYNIQRSNRDMDKHFARR